MQRRTGPSLLRVAREGIRGETFILGPEGWGGTSHKTWDCWWWGTSGHVERKFPGSGNIPMLPRLGWLECLHTRDICLRWSLKERPGPDPAGPCEPE